MSAAYSSGVPGSGSAPSSARRLRTSSVASAALSALLSLSMIGRGVPAGATSAVAQHGLEAGTPCSAMVGTSGTSVERSALVTAEHAQLAGLGSCSCVAGIGANAIGMWPPIRSVSAGPVPL